MRRAIWTTLAILSAPCAGADPVVCCQMFDIDATSILGDDPASCGEVPDADTSAEAREARNRATQCALARIRGEGADAVAERFELFLGPLELANGYHELLDVDEQRTRFERDVALRRSRGHAVPPVDEALLAALDHGLPPCAGVALGIDRLLMAMLGTDRIADVLAFDFARA